MGRSADLNVNARTEGAVKAVTRGKGGGAHGALIAAPALVAFRHGVGMTRKTATCVLAGLPPGDFPFPLLDVVAKGITWGGSFVGMGQDMAETLAFAAEGKVKADVALQPLTAINGVLDRMERDKAARRVVPDFAAHGHPRGQGTTARTLSQPGAVAVQSQRAVEKRIAPDP